MNYKSYLPLSMALAMLFSCEKPILNEEDANDTPKTITFQLFSPAQTRSTRSAAAITDFKKIYIYDSKVAIKSSCWSSLQMTPISTHQPSPSRVAITN